MKLRRAFCIWAGLVALVPAVVQADEPAGSTGKPGAGHAADQATPATPAPAAEPAAPTKDWSVTIGGDFYNEYIFRGVDVLHNQPVYVPSVIAKYKNVTAYYTGYYGDSNGPHNNWYEETDLAVDYTQPLLDGKLSLTAGGYWYLYPDANSGADTFELYGKATYACYFNPYIGINEDIDTLHGGYGVVGVTHTYELGKFIGLKEGVLTIIPSAQLGIDLGYNSRKTQADVNWNDVLLGVSVPYYITPAFCIHAGYQVSIALDSLNDASPPHHNESIINAGLSYAF